MKKIEKMRGTAICAALLCASVPLTNTYANVTNCGFQCNSAPFVFAGDNSEQACINSVISSLSQVGGAAGGGPSLQCAFQAIMSAGGGSSLGSGWCAQYNGIGGALYNAAVAYENSLPPAVCVTKTP